MVANHLPPQSERLEHLSWKEICARYPEQWIVLVEIDEESNWGFDSWQATVFAHHKTRKEASLSVKAAFAHYDEVASYWTGKHLVPPSPSLRLAL